MIDDSTESQLAFGPYILGNDVSLAVNLHEAFEESDLLSYGYQRAQVMTDSPVLMIPIDEFDESAIKILYHRTLVGHSDSAVLHAILPNLDTVAVFSMSKDLELVTADHFNDARFRPMLRPVWSYLHKRSFTGAYQKLYAYFYDKKIDVFCFQHNRLKFYDMSNAASAQDTIYFLLYAWKLLTLDTEGDELYVAGDAPERKWLTDNLYHHLQKVYYINPTAKFNRAPIINIKGIIFGLTTFFLGGK